MISGVTSSLTSGPNAWIVPAGKRFASIVTNNIDFGLFGSNVHVDTQPQRGDCSFLSLDEESSSGGMTLTYPDITFGPSQMPTAAPAAPAPPACVASPQVSQRLTVDAAWVRPGQPVSATMSATNVGCAALRVPLLGIGGRGPGGAIEDITMWSNVVLAPQETRVFAASRSFSSLGDRMIFATYRADATHWYDIPAASGVSRAATIHVVDLPSAQGGTRLGGVDLDGWCRGTHQDADAAAVQRDLHNPYSWKCVVGGVDRDIDMQNVAQTQYGAQASPVFEDRQWVAYRGEAGSDRSAPAATSPATASATSNASSGQQTTVSAESVPADGDAQIAPLNLDAYCQWAYGGGAQATQTRRDDPSSWRCDPAPNQGVMDLNSYARHLYGDSAHAALSAGQWYAYQRQGSSDNPTSAPSTQQASDLPPTDQGATVAPTQSDIVRYGGFDLDADCQERWGDGYHSEQEPPGDLNSWKCVSADGSTVMDIDMNELAKMQYGPNVCAYPDGDEWVAETCH